MRGISTTQIVTIPERFATLGAATVRATAVAGRLGAAFALVTVLAAGCARVSGHSAVDAAFAAAMVPHHEMGLTLDQLAEAGAEDVRVRRLAFEMNGYQGSELDQLRSWTTAWGGGMAAMHQGPDGSRPDGAMGMPGATDLATLAASRGPAFDRLFLTLMITHHEGAVTMADHEVGAGRNGAAVALAGRIARVQRSQLAAMRSLLAELGDG